MVSQFVIVRDSLREDPARSFTSLGYLDVRRTEIRLFVADGNRHGALVDLIQRAVQIPPKVSAVQMGWFRHQQDLVAPLRRTEEKLAKQDSVEDKLGSAVLKYQ